jgi:hypothetical protein
VLQPILGRARHGSSRAARLLELGRFLQARGLLTQGGELSLTRELRGRNAAQSLTTQDVRASAHGLVLELLAEPAACRWPEVAESYYRRFDRGKPRRPTRLQRLYLEWSPDLGPLGLLEACSTHPRLWGELRQALPSQQPQACEALLLKAACEVQEGSGWEPWLQAFDLHPALRAPLLLALPLLPHPCLPVRLEWLAGLATPKAVDSQANDLAAARLLACRLPRGKTGLGMPAPLIRLALQLVGSTPAEVDPSWLGALRGFGWPAAEVARLRAALRPEDPVHSIVYGARPGRPWLKELLEELGVCRSSRTEPGAVHFGQAELGDLGNIRTY